MDAVVPDVPFRGRWRVPLASRLADDLAEFVDGADRLLAHPGTLPRAIKG